MTTDRDALARLYRGEHGRAWQRVELERPATYWEENAVAGRRLVRRAITRWLEPVSSQTVLDAGCGAGMLARHLATLGAAVVGIDLQPRFHPSARATPGARFVVGDLRERASPVGAFTAVVLQEVLEEHPPEERVDLVRALAEWRARRMILSCRIHSAWGDWADRLAGSGLHPPVDPIALFRGIHLETPYFLTRRETLRRRNHVVEIAEFSLTYHGAEV